MSTGAESEGGLLPPEYKQTDNNSSKCVLRAADRWKVPENNKKQNVISIHTHTPHTQDRPESCTQVFSLQSDASARLQVEEPPAWGFDIIDNNNFFFKFKKKKDGPDVAPNSSHMIKIISHERHAFTLTVVDVIYVKW